jgi:transposase
MRKIKEVLRLKFGVRLGLRQIPHSCSIGLGTAHEYLQRAEAAKITWPLGPGWDDDGLEATLFGGPPRSRPTVLPIPDFADLDHQRQQHFHLTQQLLWEEYRAQTRKAIATRDSAICINAGAANRMSFCARSATPARSCLWIGRARPSRSMTPRGGPVQQAHLFVAVMGASSYVYADTTTDEQLASWIGAHVRAFEFYQDLANS